MECVTPRNCALCGQMLGKKVMQVQIVRSSNGGPYLQGACATHFTALPKKVPEHKQALITAICASSVEYVEAGMGIREAIKAAKELYGWRE